MTTTVYTPVRAKQTIILTKEELSKLTGFVETTQWLRIRPQPSTLVVQTRPYFPLHSNSPQSNQKQENVNFEIHGRTRTLKCSLNSQPLFGLFPRSPQRDVWIHSPLMSSSDVTTLITRAMRHRVSKCRRFFIVCVVVVVELSYLHSTVLITSLFCSRKMADACLVCLYKQETSSRGITFTCAPFFC